MYEHVKTGCKDIPPSEKTLQFQSGYFLNKLRRARELTYNNIQLNYKIIQPYN